MNATALALLIIIIAVALVACAVFYVRHRRTENLRKQFGPEYKRTVDRFGDQRKAETELAAREKRVRTFEVRTHRPEEQARFSHAWRKTQARFVDEPSVAVREVDGMVKEVMQMRGYPMADFEQRAADISVDDHPSVVTNYRAARDIAQRNNSGKATTEDLWQAMVHYRSLFEELLDAQIPTIRKEAV
jgi:hypothetical protein